MSKTAETNKSGLLLGLLIGTAMGATLSSLLNSKSDTTVSEDLSKTYSFLTEQKNKLTCAVKDTALDVAGTIVNHATEISNKAKEGKQILEDKLQDEKEEDTQEKSS